MRSTINTVSDLFFPRMAPQLSSQHENVQGADRFNKIAVADGGRQQRRMPSIKTVQTNALTNSLPVHFIHV